MCKCPFTALISLLHHAGSDVEGWSSMFFWFFWVKPCRRRFSASRWAFFPFSVRRYLLWASRWFFRLPESRHSSQQYAWPRKQRRQMQNIKSHHRHRIWSDSKTDMPPVLQTTGRWVRYESNGGLPAVCGSSLFKARSCSFGLFLYVAELNVKKWNDKN